MNLHPPIFRFDRRLLPLAVSATLLTSSPSLAETYMWIGADGAGWSDPTAWSPAGLPGEGDDVQLEGTGPALSAQTIVYAGVDDPYLYSLQINGCCHELGGVLSGHYTTLLLNAGDTLTVNHLFGEGTLKLSYGQVHVTGWANIYGYFNQNNSIGDSVVTAGRLVVSGSYALNSVGNSALNLNVETETIVVRDVSFSDGEAVFADFMQTGGVFNTYSLLVGRVPEIALSGAPFVGSFDQSGGEVFATDLFIGYFHCDWYDGDACYSTGDNNSIGRYLLSGGTLTVGRTTELEGSYYGSSLVSTFMQSGGTFRTNDLLIAGSGGDGIYILIGGDVIAYSIFVGSSGVFKQSGGNVQSGYLDIYGSYQLSDIDGPASLTVGGNEYINGSAGSFTQTGGAHTIGGDLFVSWSSGGSFTLNGGSVEVAGSAVVGRSAVGSMTLSGGSLTVGGSLIVSDTAAAGGGTGSVLQQSGGEVHVGGELVLGNQAGALGYYLLSAGSLSVQGADAASQFVVGNAGTGHFVFDSGAVTVDGLQIAVATDSYGVLTMNGGSLTVTGNSGDVIGSLGIGVFLQQGGMHSTPDLVLGSESGGAGGVYGLSGGTLSVTDNTTVGLNTGGQFEQEGGTFETGALLLGLNSGGSGYYFLNDGSLSSRTQTVVGYAGEGEFYQSGGTHTVAELVLAQEAGSSGLYELDGGTLTVTGTAMVGRSGSGEFVQSGGVVAIGGDLLLGVLPGSNGHYQLGGGTLTIGGMLVLGGSGSANGGSGRFDLGSSASLQLRDLDLRPGGELSSLGGGVTLGDATAGLADVGTLRVNNGGMLAGNGTIPGSAWIYAGGVVRPGNSIGTLNFAGDLTFLPGSTLNAEIDSSGHSDLITTTGTITLTGVTLRVDSTDGSFDAGSTYTLLSAGGGIHGSFASVISGLPFFNLVADYSSASAVSLSAVPTTTSATETSTTTGTVAVVSGAASVPTVATLHIPTPDEHAADSPLDLIGGSPTSLLGRMTLADAEAGFLLDPLTAGFDEGQAAIGLKLGNFYADGYHQHYETVPLRYGWKFGNGMTALVELPISSITTRGHGINRDDRSYGLGTGLRMPISAGWELKPMLRYGTVLDNDQRHIGSLASTSLTSHYRHGFGDGYEIGLDNLVGAVRSVGGNVTGLDAGYDLHETTTHNAVRLSGPLQDTVLGHGARWTAWASDTRYFGSKLAVDNFQRVGIAATTRLSVGDRYSDTASLGLTYTHTASGNHGLELNFGYRF